MISLTRINAIRILKFLVMLAPIMTLLKICEYSTLIGRREIHFSPGKALIWSLFFGTGVLFQATGIQAEKLKLRGSTEIFDLPIRGVVRPSAQAAIATHISARVVSVPFKEGEAFRKGDLLIEFDCKRQRAEFASIDATRREMLANLNSALFLKRRNAGSKHDADTARARFDKAKADSAAILVRLEECKISAPYDGRIATLNIHPHELPATTDPLLSIVALKHPQIELVVPSNWLTWLKKGSQFRFLVEETGNSYTGKVERIAPTVSTVSQTIKVYAKFVKATDDILPGMSGTAEFPGLGG